MQRTEFNGLKLKLFFFYFKDCTLDILQFILHHVICTTTHMKSLEDLTLKSFLDVFCLQVLVCLFCLAHLLLLSYSAHYLAHSCVDRLFFFIDWTLGCAAHKSITVYWRNKEALM